LDQLVGQRLEHFNELAQQHDIRFVTNFSHSSGAVRLDQCRMAQVFDNVIQNAIDAMSGTGGTLCVNVTRGSAKPGNAPEACVEFNDTGEGIRADVLGRIFDPFFTTKSSGTGLGLSICHELVQAHGGEIHIVSAEGCGTTVRILLPLFDGQSAGQSV
jgi:two-component system NtrC family sensor kinase